MPELVLYILEKSNYFELSLILIVLFALLYIVISSSFYFAIQFLLKKNIVVKISEIKLFPNQIRFEMLHSLFSIIIFGLYGVLIVFCVRNNVVSIQFNNDLTIILHLLILIIWNEIHFYILHKMMHTKYFINIHRTHHKSVVVTPFSTYSFHPIESLIFGSVMILPMLVFNFELIALIIFPIYHLFFNTLGHSNVTLRSKFRPLDEISNQHNNHHLKYNFNFGFVSPIMDRLFRTFIR